MRQMNKKQKEPTFEEKDKLIKGIENPNVSRYKGLGEMNAEELWETTMNPATRYLKQINSEDAAKADEVFTMLMGDEVAPRKRFIMTHAKQALVDM